MAFLPRHAVSRDFEITSLTITTWLYLLGWTPVLGAAKMAIAENETPGELPAGGRIADLSQNEVLATHSTLPECCGGHAEKKGARHDWPEPPSVPGLFQTAVLQRLIKRMVYIRSKRSFCITLVHAATKSLTNLSCASSAA